MLNLLPGYAEDKDTVVLFDPDSSFTLYPSVEYDERKPNHRYFIYGNQDGRTYIIDSPQTDYYVFFGFVRTDRKGNWIPFQICL